MAEINDILERLSKALDIYARLLEVAAKQPEQAAVLEQSIKRLRWAIGDMAQQIYRETKN